MSARETPCVHFTGGDCDGENGQCDAPVPSWAISPFEAIQKRPRQLAWRSTLCAQCPNYLQRVADRNPEGES